MLPPNAKKFPDPFDPKDRVEFILTLDGPTGILEDGEGVGSYELTLTAEAVALGLTLGSGTFAPSQPLPNQIKFWLEVDGAFLNNAAFSGAGTDLGIEVTVTTNSNPARRRQRTAVITVAQQ